MGNKTRLLARVGFFPPRGWVFRSRAQPESVKHTPRWEKTHKGKRVYVARGAIVTDRHARCNWRGLRWLTQFRLIFTIFRQLFSFYGLQVQSFIFNKNSNSVCSLVERFLGGDAARWSRGSSPGRGAEENGRRRVGAAAGGTVGQGRGWLVGR